MFCSIYQFFVSRGFFGWPLGHFWNSRHKRTLANQGHYAKYFGFFKWAEKLRIPVSCLKNQWNFRHCFLFPISHRGWQIGSRKQCLKFYWIFKQLRNSKTTLECFLNDCFSLCWSLCLLNTWTWLALGCHETFKGCHLVRHSTCSFNPRTVFWGPFGPRRPKTRYTYVFMYRKSIWALGSKRTPENG